MLGPSFFSPKSIAVVGASRNSAKIGNIVLTNLQEAGYIGSLYPINPKAEEINGLQVYKNVQDCPEIPELCIISLPVQYILQEIDEAIDFGCKQFVVFTAGFKEIGKEGRDIEESLINKITNAGATLLGPNCLGFLHTPSGVNATFAKASMSIGNFSLISQSGAIASAFFDRSTSVGVFMKDCITIGNKATLNENDLLEYRLHEGGDGPIGLYLEEISEGKTFMQLCKKLSNNRPLLLLKPGKSEAANHAMQSHTGSIAGDDAVLQTVCEQTGMIRCETIQDLFDLSMYFSWQNPPKGNRIAIISNAGGPGVTTTDLIEGSGLKVAEIGLETQAILKEQLPRAASVADPIDLLGDAKSDRYNSALEAVLNDEGDVDAVIILLTPQMMTEVEETAKVISHLSKRYNLPIVCSFIGLHDVTIGKKILRNHRVPCYDYPTRAVYALSNAWKWREKRIVGGNEDSIDGNSFEFPSGQGLLGVGETQLLMKQYAISTPKTTIVETFDDVLKFAESVGYPVVMKLVGPELLHKIDFGGVVVDITGETLENEFRSLENVRQEYIKTGKEVSLQLQEQILNAVECIVGCKYDINFGSVLIFGAGGTLTELFDDHVMRVLPISRKELKRMVEESSIFPLLNGYRGKSKVDIDSLLDVLQGFIELIQSSKSIEQAEINPILVNKDGAWAVDPKIILR